jgi:hypothetical protein
MTISVLKELYHSPNGDRWALCRAETGTLVVSHQPNKASGGQGTQTDVQAFLAQAGCGPEHQALIAALAKLDGVQSAAATDKCPGETAETLSQALGQAVARCWSILPQEIQHDLFEAAVASEGETIRPQLAVYLHGKHERTADAVQARAIPEPDSLGG